MDIPGGYHSTTETQQRKGPPETLSSSSSLPLNTDSGLDMASAHSMSIISCHPGTTLEFNVGTPILHMRTLKLWKAEWLAKSPTAMSLVTSYCKGCDFKPYQGIPFGFSWLLQPFPSGAVEAPCPPFPTFCPATGWKLWCSPQVPLPSQCLTKTQKMGKGDAASSPPGLPHWGVGSAAGCVFNAL